MKNELSGLIAELKTVVLDATERDAPEGGLGDDEPLFGPEARLDLDSLDALQVSMAIQQRYGVRMPDSKETRRALASIAHLAQHLHGLRQSGAVNAVSSASPGPSVP